MKDRKPGMLAVTLSLFFFSLAIFFLTSYGSRIQRIVLKNDLFDKSAKSYDFIVDQLGDGRYRVKLKLLKTAGTNESGVFENRINFEIGVRLTDSKDNLVIRKVINKDSNAFTSFTRDYIEMTLFSFNAKRHEKYRLEVSFASSEGFFDLFLKRSNVLLIEEAYDPAAMPWLYFINFISKGMLIATFLLSVLLMVLILKKKAT